MLTTKYRIASTLEEVDHKLSLVQLPGYIDMIKALQRVHTRCEVLMEVSPATVSEELRHEFSCMRADIRNILDKTKLS
jgi:hypothetical protein